MSGCKNKNETSSDNDKTSSNTSILFPTELVDFIPIEQNPVFKGTGTDTWDKNIRERGYILKEDDGYKMWYTGFDGSEDPTMHLGYATPTAPQPYGLKTIIGIYYERGDLGIWLAVSADHKVWTNVQDDPVIELGPGAYDAEGVAINQVIKYQGRYYAYFHGTPDEDWSTWNSNVAVSDDLIYGVYSSPLN